MANEITVVARVTVANGNFRGKFEPPTKLISQVAQGGHAPIVSVGTSEEDLSLGDIVAPGLVCLLNLDPTNFVKYGPKTGAGAMQELGRLINGEPAILRLGPSGVTLRWVADTAACKVQVFALEN